ncbi:MAG: ATP-binding protein [Calothrix sp. C42_A2020_038]|nr:ATP-binding protein [Calothrix sp. C42_A2020_038]
MATIEDIIRSEVNPFDLVNIKPMNFWDEKQDSEFTVNSIHQEAIVDIERELNLVATTHRSRTVLLVGDPGSGKSYLLGRLKRTLNSKAFFAYILCNWSDDYIWRHILRYTVDSLIQVPEGQEESQLILWLKSLSAFTKCNLSIWNLLHNDRQKFIKHLKDTYKQARLYNADIFFGVLHDLTNPDLYSIACEWLRGDDLSQESMQALRIRSCIDTEDAAKNILANLGKISKETQPIVLCFDNLDTMPKLADGLLNIQPFFDVNTTIHGENLKNFLVVISIITNTWNINLKNIQQADKAGIHKVVKLKSITLDQAEAIWNHQLRLLHEKANPKPNSPIFPLTRQVLEENFPGGKTYPRHAINLGKDKYDEYKKIINGSRVDTTTDEEKKQAAFELLWQKEIKETQKKINKITFIPANQLIQVLQLSLEALQLQSVKLKLLSGKYANYSLSYQHDKTGKIGVIWTEDVNMTSFFNIMNATHKVIQQNLCQKIYLIRMAGVGDTKLKGYQLYHQIFTGTKNIHIKPNLQSVHILLTYQNLVNSAISQELVILGKTINVSELQSLIRKSKILAKCPLLQDLGIVPKEDVIEKIGREKDLRPVKAFLLNLVTTQNFMGIPTLFSHASSQFPDVSDRDVKQLFNLLCDENRLKVMNPKAKLEEQLVCLVAN